jgi:hypothetical protein
VKWLLFYCAPLCAALNLSTGTDPGKEFPAPVAQHFYRLGSQLLSLDRFGSANTASYTLVSLDNTPVSSSSIFSFVATSKDVSLLHLSFTGSKKITTRLDQQEVSIDPEHLFTTEGRRESLKQTAAWNRKTSAPVQDFARFLEEQLKNEMVVVSYQEASEQENLGSYAEGGIRQLYALELSVTDTHNKVFVATTDKDWYEGLRDAGINTVLLSRYKAVDDGSLSFYCLKKGRPFIKLVGDVENSKATAQALSAVHNLLVPKKDLDFTRK